MSGRDIFIRAAFASGVMAGVVFLACVQPPPKIAAIPPDGIALRLFIFGASAQDTRNAFGAAKQTNKNLTIVREGGDGEVLIGLENDSPKCVAPTALCSFKVAVRIKDAQGKVVHTSMTSASATSERCNDLCEQAVNNVVVKVVEMAVTALKAGGDPDASTPDPEALADDAGPPIDAGAAKTPPKKPATGKKDKEPPKPEPAICAVGHGTQLPSDEAERRAAQVEALKRIDVLDQEEYDCLRKAYLDRL